ncbi:hypothetical protein DACRYDRAFT_113786 [Dacryopinax primogenitus]|uniref:Uncharacterized protein n=1 Tax=Dacryopinax primogenitus (strain DJM 731) TaxID=1858805 RepID=M5GGM3_DACPD|nr:uncharacterized protein DACRYDRAFT_113786 [Dacryopinax primogenitus]EJU05738.1 hypothetical protein DACRYDRAFT_113786 [Dacryopinax primogenitus]
MNSPVSPRRGAGTGRFTPSGVVDQAHESEWASRLAGLDWDETSIVFTKRQLVDFLRYLGVHVDSNCENIAGLPRYAVFGKISSLPGPILPSSLSLPAQTNGTISSTTHAHAHSHLISGPSTPTTSDFPQPIPMAIPAPVAGGFRPTHRQRTSRNSLPRSGSPQTAGLFGPGDDGGHEVFLSASPPERTIREAVRPTVTTPSYPPPDTAQPEPSDEEDPPPPALHIYSHSHSHSHSHLSTPPATPSRQQSYRSRQSSGGLSSLPAVMFPIENVQHTSTGYPVGPGAGGSASGRGAGAGTSSATGSTREMDGHGMSGRGGRGSPYGRAR